MKKLCFISFNILETGGVNRVISSICNELCDVYDIHVISLCSDGKECKYTLDRRISLYGFNMNKNDRIRNLIIKSFFGIIKYIHNNNIDVVLMIGHYIPPFLFPVKPFVKCKFVFCDHGALSNQLDDRKATLFRRIACRISDKVVVLTKRTMRDYIKKFGISKDKISYIYNFIDSEVFKKAGVYKSNTRKILSVGRLCQEKGYNMLVDVADKVLCANKDWQWHIYGDGEQFEQIQRMIYEKGLKDKLLLMGENTYIYDVYKNYSIFVLTSYREGFPLVLLEARANGLPIVSFNCITGPSEIVTNNSDGILIECYDISKMADSICKLINDEEMRERLSSESKNGLEKFNKKVIIDEWRKLIDAL